MNQKLREEKAKFFFRLGELSFAITVGAVIAGWAKGETNLLVYFIIIIIILVAGIVLTAYFYNKASGFLKGD